MMSETVSFSGLAPVYQSVCRTFSGAVTDRTQDGPFLAIAVRAAWESARNSASGRLGEPSPNPQVGVGRNFSMATVSSTAVTGQTPSVAHRREQHDLPDRALSGQDHDKPVDPDPDPAGRRHPVLER